MEILQDIPFRLDEKALYSKLRMDPEGVHAGALQRLVRAALPVIRPKAVYEVSFTRHLDPQTVALGEARFASRVLRVNLDNVHRVFPFIATCGTEADGIPVPEDDFVQQFWLDTLKEQALEFALDHLEAHLKKRFALGRLSSMSPGAATQEVWPIEDQTPLFSLFGDVERLIGVRLTESLLMIPAKSVSGIFFPTEIPFESCKLCPREDCPERRAPFDRDLLDSYNSQ